MNSFKALLCFSYISIFIFSVSGAENKTQAEFQWPEKWMVFAPFSSTDVLPEKYYASIPSEISIGTKKIKGKLETLKNGSFDFAGYLDVQKNMNDTSCAYAFALIDAQEDIRINAGAAADWWMEWRLDGKIIMSTMEHGNIDWPLSIKNHVFSIHLTKGTHVLSIRFIRGSKSSLLVCGGPRELKAAGLQNNILSINDDLSFMKKITDIHPRLFLNKKILEKLRKEMTPLQKKYISDTMNIADKYPANPNIASVKDAWGSVNDWGPQSARCALVYLFTGKKEYFIKALTLLKFSIDWYNRRYAEKKPVSWYSHSRIAALCTYDWLYNEIPEEERKEIGEKFFKHILQTQDRSFVRLMPEEGPSGPWAGFYGVPNLAWYAGLTFYKNGIDDKKAEELILKGYRDHLAMFRKRSENAGNNGGSNTPCVPYAAGDYFYQEYNFFYSWKAITGDNFADFFPGLALFPNWLIWTLIQGPDGHLFEYGYGDSWHIDNRVRPPLLYLSQYPDFYGKKFPDLARISQFILSKMPESKDPYSPYRECFYTRLCFYPMLFEASNLKDTRDIESIIREMPHARYFPAFGQIFMNTGWDNSSTYCLFTGGGKVRSHKHFDEGNFVIYKEDFLAIDSGTRGASGKEGSEIDEKHCRNYSHRTIAHNCILIKMNNELFEKEGYPVSVHPEVNDGGSRSSIGSKLDAFETNDHYTYIANNLKEVYHQDKCESCIRQFVFVYPDFFIIFDRVVSKDKSQKKTWLLHTNEEPCLKENSFSATYGNGKLICKTLLPSDALIEKIGGNGSEFQADGKNWLPSPQRLKERIDRKEQWGSWRVEVSDKKEEKETLFLNFIQVGANNKLIEMVPVKLIENESSKGIEFKYEDKVFSVRFNANEKSGGSVQIEKNNCTIFQKSFSSGIEEQKGLALQKSR